MEENNLKISLALYIHLEFNNDKQHEKLSRNKFVTKSTDFEQGLTKGSSCSNSIFPPTVVTRWSGISDVSNT